MKRIFIAYADQACAYSLKRIGRQARRLGIFDEVILYTPSDLPDYVLKSPLMQNKNNRGGGYWVWKPAIIYETLQSHADGDVVVYVDAGCTLNRSTEWDLMFKLMKEYDTICFHYDDMMPVWEKYGNSSTKIKYWIKKTARDFMDTYLQDESWHEKNMVLGGILFIKGKENKLIKQLLDIMLAHPDLVVDYRDDELKDQIEGFAFHTHDQPFITALTASDKNALVLPEISDANARSSFVWAERLRARNFRQFIIEKSKHLMREYWGDDFVDRLKHCFIPY